MIRKTWSPWLGQVPLAGQRRQIGIRRRLGQIAALTDDTFSQATSAPAAVIDFWGDGCLPCMKYKPIFEDVASSAPSWLFMASANMGGVPNAALTYKIDSMPITLFLANGQEVDRIEGGTSKQDLLDHIAKAFPNLSAAAAASPPPPPTLVVPDQSQTPPDQVMPPTPGQGQVPPPPAAAAPTAAASPAPAVASQGPSTAPPTSTSAVPSTPPKASQQAAPTPAKPGAAPTPAAAAGSSFFTTPVIIGGIAVVAIGIGVILATSSGK